MKKELLVLTISALLLATPVFAARGNNHSQGTTQKELHSNVQVEENSIATIEPEESPSPSASPVATGQPSAESLVIPSSTPTPDCDKDKVWKNHGQFVSCVAHEHQGGEEVSEAARSDIGKKHHQPSASPSAIPTASPSPSPTPPISFTVMSFNP